MAVTVPVPAYTVALISKTTDIIFLYQKHRG